MPTAVREKVELFSGEYLVSSQRNLIITTLLGSCVAVCLYDHKSGAGGMNHFLLPGIKPAVAPEEVKEGNYGLLSLGKLLADFRERGISPGRLQAKVFGGACMIRQINADIAEANVRMALAFLRDQGIPVIGKDVGGVYGRRIFFLLDDFSVYVKTITQSLPYPAIDTYAIG